MAGTFGGWEPREKNPAEMTGVVHAEPEAHEHPPGVMASGRYDMSGMDPEVAWMWDDRLWR